MTKRQGNEPRRSRKRNNALEQETDYLIKEWLQLERALQPIRLKVFHQIDSVLKQNQLTTVWLQEALMDVVPERQRDRVARSTISEWQNRGYIKGRHPNPHEAALLLIVRELVSHIDPDRERYWLPEGNLSFEVEEALLQRQLREHTSMSQQPYQKHKMQSGTPFVSPLGLLRTGWVQNPPEVPGQPPPPPLTSLIPPFQDTGEKILQLAVSFWLGEL